MAASSALMCFVSESGIERANVQDITTPRAYFLDCLYEKLGPGR